MKYLDLDLLENPYGRRVGGGYDTVRVGDGGRLHVQGKDGGPLCMQGRVQTDLRRSEGRVVDCYRCIKLMAMNANAPLLGRDLTTSRGEKRKHLMVPGGRQGRFVAEKKLSPYAESGAAPFKRGPSNHPTQPWMTGRKAMAKTREERVREEGIALPANYLPPSVEEHDAYVAELVQDVKRGKRRMADRQRLAARAASAAAAAAASEREEMERLAGYANNPYTGRHARHGMPYMTFGNPRSAPAGAAEAMRLYRSGEASSLKEAWAIVKGGRRSRRGRR